MPTELVSTSVMIYKPCQTQHQQLLAKILDYMSEDVKIDSSDYFFIVAIIWHDVHS